MKAALRLSLAALAASVAAALCAPSFAQPITYPVTAKIDHVDTYFGTKIEDPYHWLEDDNSPQTKAWVEAENKVTFDYLDRIPYRPAVRDRIRAISNYAKFSGPLQKGGKVFFYKNDGLQNQASLYVQNGLAGTPELLIDPNTFSPDGTVRMSDFTPSGDGKFAAYQNTAIPGSDWQDIHVIDLKTKRVLPETLHWIKFSEIAWRGDGFYYSRYPQPAKGTELTVRTENQKVYFHKIGTEQSADALVFEDPEHAARFVGVSTTEDERFALLTSQQPGTEGNSLFVRDDSKGERTFRPIVPEISDDRFDVAGNVGDQLLVLTTRGAPNRKLMRVDPAHPAFADWSTVLAERPEPLIDVTQAGGKLFVNHSKDVTSRVEVHTLDGKLERHIDLPGLGEATGFAGEKAAGQVFYMFSSMNQPPTIFSYDIAKAKSSVFRAPEIPGFDPNRYQSRQLFFTSKDGTRVPMFVVHKKGLRLDGRNPTILYGYGGFNIVSTPYFSAPRIVWLEQGGVFAIVNLRGGGEYGEAWHQAGMRLKKQNVFDDCIAAAEYLIQQGYTSPDRLALQGGSNGGLLVGAVINQRPDLFAVALPAVGVMDMLRFQKFSVGAAWTSDYGSSDDETQFKYLLGYSPLHNIKAGAKYPATLISTSDHDDRVVPAHSFKYAATLQAKAGGNTPKLIRIETNSGHGSSNLSKALDEAADTYSFLWTNMGVVPNFEH